jgi:HEAT repeat protein
MMISPLPANISAALGDSDLSIRLAAENALIDAGASAVEPLIAAIASPETDSEARWRAACVLGEIGNVNAVEPLLAAIQESAWDLRHSALWSLGVLGDFRAFEPLRALVEDDQKEEQIRLVAALGLTYINQPQAIEALQTAAEHSSAGVRRTARAVLARLEYPDWNTRPKPRV